MTILPTGMPSSWQARTCFFAAALFTLASGGTNLIYGWNKGADTASSLVWAAVSIAVSAVFVLSWPAILMSLDRRQWARAVMALVALLLTGTYSVSAALGSAMGGRANAAIEEKDTSDKRTKAQTAYDTAKGELEKIAAARSVPEVEALIRGAAMNPRGSHGCTAVNGSLRMSCPKLEAEKARAQRRDTLKAEMAKAQSQLDNAKPAKLANSDAVALASYLSGLGIETSADRVNKLLVLLAVLVIECGGGLALAVGMALSESGGRSGQSERAIGQGERSLSERPTEHLNASPERIRETTREIGLLDRSAALNDRPARSAHERVLSALRAKDGVLFGSQVALGAAFGWSKTRLHEILHELQAAGRVRLSISRQGTAVRLVA